MGWEPIETCPAKQNVLLCDADGNIYIGQNFNDAKWPIFKSDIDFGDFTSQFFWQKDWPPVGWMAIELPDVAALVEGSKREDA